MKERILTLQDKAAECETSENRNDTSIHIFWGIRFNHFSRHDGAYEERERTGP